MKQNRHLFNVIIFILIVSFILPVGANAAASADVMPLASDYLTAYSAYICAMGNGELQIWFRVNGTDDWADIGALRIMLYESSDQSNWTWVKTFRHANYEQMLAHDIWHVLDHVDYKGTPGKYYKAYVTIWAGDEETGDTRYIWTPVELCT